MKPDKNLYSVLRKQAKLCHIEAFEVRPHVLRIYAELSATSHAAKFDFRDVTSVVKKLEKTLGKNDMFFSNGEIALGITKMVFGNPGNVNIFFYGDRMMFSGGSPATSAAATSTTPATIVLPEFSAVELLYNSSLSLKTDSKVRLEGLDTSIFRFVPDVQETVTTRAGGRLNFVDIGANYVIQGGVENTAEISFDGIGDKTNIAGALGQNYAVILMPGYIVKGGANNPKFVAYANELQQGDI